MGQSTVSPRLKRHREEETESSSRDIESPGQKRRTRRLPVQLPRSPIREYIEGVLSGDKSRRNTKDELITAASVWKDDGVEFTPEKEKKIEDEQKSLTLDEKLLVLNEMSISSLEQEHPGIAQSDASFSVGQRTRRSSKMGKKKKSYSSIEVPCYREVSMKIHQHAAFELPDEYVRWNGPKDVVGAQCSDYEFDNSDEKWCRKNKKCVQEDVFEYIMGQLEGSYLELGVRQRSMFDNSSAEDARCCVCNDGEYTDNNQILFCDGCDIAVHQKCYGIVHLPGGEWFCDRCRAGGRDVQCVFCHSRRGAFKPTSEGEWAHVACAFWLPEPSFGDVEKMSPIIDCEKVDPERYTVLVCELCKIPGGACIQCTYGRCCHSFHVSCALEFGLYVKILPSFDRVVMCRVHHKKMDVPAHCGNDEGDTIEQMERRFSAAFEEVRQELHVCNWKPRCLRDWNNGKPKRISRSQLDKVFEHWSTKKRQPAQQMAQLLREAATRRERERDMLRKLRVDLERVRIIAELVRKREQRKRILAQTVRGISEERICQTGMCGTSSSVKEKPIRVYRQLHIDDLY